jgi:hypothetical protein
VIPTDEILARHHVLVRSDNDWQRTARLRQALWREANGPPIGEHRGKPLGSRIAMPYAMDTLANYVTETIRNVVRAEVLDPTRSAGKMFTAPRIFEDLLSSQPLCFNLFGELQRDLVLASRVFGNLLGDLGLAVTAIEFEHSPGRADARFTDDHSAFDVFVEYTSSMRAPGFVGVEVKYVEDLDVPAARHRARYDEVAAAMGCFIPDALPRLRSKPLEQLWRDHLLAGSLMLEHGFGFRTGTFAVVYPLENLIVATAVGSYRACLTDGASFTAWTLKQVLDAINEAGAAGWARAVRERYLATAR